jgi:hypothetical protein
MEELIQGLIRKPATHMKTMEVLGIGMKVIATTHMEVMDTSTMEEMATMATRVTIITNLGEGMDITMDSTMDMTATRTTTS